MDQSNVDLHAPENRQRLAKMILCLFDHWNLNVWDQAALLDLPADANELSRYRSGAPFPDSQDLLGRVGHLLGIHRSLRLIFPHNIDLAYCWITAPNRRFNGARPLDVMKKGLDGIIAVRRYLESEQP